MVEIAGGGAKSLKRFYREATFGPSGESFGVFLDGRPARTPRRALLDLPNLPLAEAVVAEWAAAGETIALDDLRLTRLAATAIDLGAATAPAWRDDVVRFAASDLLCYRAGAPEALVRRQAEAWDPFISWARRALGAPFVTTSGIVAVDQPDMALAAVARAVETLGPWRLIAVKTATEITGSALLALALEQSAFAADRIFAASRVDEAYQAEIWGCDAEAEARVARLRRDFDAAALFLSLLAL